MSNAPTEVAAQGNGLKVQVLSTRGAGGWGSRDIAIPHDHETGTSGNEEQRFFSEDLASAVVQPIGSFNPGLSDEASEQTAYLQTLGGCENACFRPLVTGKPGFENVPPGTSFGEESHCLAGVHNSQAQCGPFFLDATSDLSHVVFESQYASLEAGVPSNELYEWSGGRIQMVSMLPPNGEGEELPAPAGEKALAAVGYPNRGRVSGDGARVFWATPGALYVRDTVLHRSLQIDTAEPGCGECESGDGRFQDASADGARLFFTDERKLTQDAGTGSGKDDLFECVIVVAEAGGLSCGANGPRDVTPLTAGESADVQGVVLGASADAEELYFVAMGTLGTEPNVRGQSATAGQPNLYVRSGARTRFIATLAAGDAYDWQGGNLPTRVSPNGQWLSFMSERSLTGYDNLDAVSGRPDAEIYLYDASTGSLVCTSCDPTGARPLGAEYHQVAGADVEGLVAGDIEWEPSGWVASLPPVTTKYSLGHSAYQGRYLSNSGRLFFNSRDALVPQDVNGNWDVYEYEPAGYVRPEGEHPCTTGAATFNERSGGCTALISSGTSPQQSAFLDASETGGDVFFITAARLTTQDVDSNFDVYDAHECTSASPCIPPPAVAPPPCITEASCRPAPTPQPSIFGAPSSATFEGPASLLLSAPAPANQQTKTRTPTRGQELAKALNACHRRYPHAKTRRAGCERKARAKYAKKPAKRATNHRRTK